MKKLIALFSLSFFWETTISNTQNIYRIRYILDSTNSSSPFFGNILIIKNNKILFEKSYGYADAVNKKPLTEENSFQRWRLFQNNLLLME